MREVAGRVAVAGESLHDTDLHLACCVTAEEPDVEGRVGFRIMTNEQV